MMLTKKILAGSTAVISLVGALVMSGCGGNATKQIEHPQSLKIWYYEDDTSAQGKAWKQAIKDYEKKTGVKVNLEKKIFEQIRQNSSQILNSDDAPDVMEYNKGNATAGLLSSQGLLSNLNDYVEKYNWDKKVTGALAVPGKYDEKGVMGSGDWYGITTYGEEVMMYYNKDMFDKYGIAIPKTVSELEVAMQKFKDNGVTALSEGVAEYPLQHLWWQLVLQKADSKLINAYQRYEGNVDWQGPAMTYATQTIRDWVDKGYISKDCTGMKAEDAGQNFIKGSYPMLFSGTWWFGRFQDEMSNVNWEVRQFPEAKKIPGGSGNIWVIPERSKKKDAAAQFIDMTLSKDNQNLMGNAVGLPIAADPGKITEPRSKKLIAEFNEVIKEDRLGYYPDWPTSTFYDELNAGLQELVNGTKDPKSVLQEFKEKYDKGVETAGLKK